LDDGERKIVRIPHYHPVELPEFRAFKSGNQFMEREKEGLGLGLRL
jgi:hypothetical protein